MQARMQNPALIIPEAMAALQALGAAIEKAGLPAATLSLIDARASQINGCGVCLDGHCRIMKRRGEDLDRVIALPGWRHAPYYTDAERAALALTEALTRVADNADPVPDAVWKEAARHYDETQLAALMLAIAQINVWNRLNVGAGVMVGDWKP
jgi:AhpD family alkylhydroperoxidase